MNKIRSVLVSLALLFSAATSLDAAEAGEKLRLLRADNELLRSLLDDKSKEIERLKKANAELSKQVTQLQKVCQKAGIPILATVPTPADKAVGKPHLSDDIISLLSSGRLAKKLMIPHYTGVVKNILEEEKTQRIPGWRRAEKERAINMLALLRRATPHLPTLGELAIGKMGKLTDRVELAPFYVKGRIQMSWIQAKCGQGVCQVKEVVNDVDTLIYIGRGRRLVYLRNYPHRKVDGERLDTGETAFKVVGRKTYKTTAGGSNTLYVIEPMDLSVLKTKPKSKAK